MMRKHTNWILLVLIGLSVIAFLLFTIPNSKASEDLAMVSMFEPDEGVMIPVIQQMVAPRENTRSFVYHFIAYEFYSYGFPHFAPSALVLLVLKWLSLDGKMPAVMLSLRQVISVLPMLLVLLLLVYMQDRFKTYRSIVLFLFLLFVPALVQNGFWWHPDGLVLLLSTLVIFFLWKDGRRFKWLFFAAAAVCGIMVALKIVGVYFFLTIGMVLIWGLVEKKLTWKKLIWVSVGFILIMLIAAVIASPHLFIPVERELAFNILRREILETSKGYGVVYEKGLGAAWPTLIKFYGQAIFLLTTIAVTIWGVWKKESRFLHALTLAWFIPLSIYLIFFSHFKYQYWLPVAIPLFSNLVILLPASKADWQDRWVYKIIRILLILIVAIQLGFFIKQSSQTFIKRTERAESNQEIAFYALAMEKLEPLGQDPVSAYYDYRLYLPEKENWSAETSYELLSYAFLDSRQYDLLFLYNQRIRDYLDPSAEGIDPQAFEQSQAFYRDAEAGTIEKYYLLFKNETALLFIRDGFCQQYYVTSVCP
jgi:4-amino-4-deoxy-L-arabinose transferase-like glycosyltransferase